MKLLKGDSNIYNITKISISNNAVLLNYLYPDKKQSQFQQKCYATQLFIILRIIRKKFLEHQISILYSYITKGSCHTEDTGLMAAEKKIALLSQK